MKLPKFKIRASQFGEIAANLEGLTQKQLDRLNELEEKGSKSKELKELIAKRDNSDLPAGAKTYCKRWVQEKIYNRSKEIQSKYLDKGNECEDDSIKFLSDYYFMNLSKNEESFEDEHFTGTPDLLVLDDEVWDVKNSYSFETFPLFDYGIKNAAYKWQGLVYLALTKRSKFRLCYTLVNLPEHMIMDEVRKLSWKSEKSFEELYVEAEKFYTYDEIDDSLRLKTFEFIRDDDKITKMRKRVEACREYIESELIPNIGGMYE